MTAYTSFLVGGTTGIPNAFAIQPRGILKQQYDVAQFVAVNGFVAGDTERLVTIPARTFVIIHAVIPDSTLVLGGTPVFSLGDSGSGTLYINASSNVTKDAHMTLATTSKMYDAADYLLLTLNNSTGTVTSGTFTVVYEMVDCTAWPTAQASTQV